MEPQPHRKAIPIQSVREISNVNVSLTANQSQEPAATGPLFAGRNSSFQSAFSDTGRKKNPTNVLCDFSFQWALLAKAVENLCEQKSENRKQVNPTLLAQTGLQMRLDRFGAVVVSL